ncbi:MAG: nucleotidyltransferase family protein [Candidatus Omnitrophota bacterium]
MKALILAGGRGKRLGGITDYTNKCMLSIGGKPLIEYSLDCVSNLDILTEIVIVVGYKADEIINRYGNDYNCKPIRYVIQQEQRGLVHAIECAQEAVGKDDLMLMLGDEFMVNPKHQEMAGVFQKEDLFGVCGVIEVEDVSLIKKTYSIIQSNENQIYRLIEKPSNPMNNIMGMGNCIFKNEIFSYIPHTPINQKRAEKELPDLIQSAIDEGNKVKSFLLCDKYVNVNVSQEIEEAKSCFYHF